MSNPLPNEQPRTFEDLYTDLLGRLHIPTTQSASVTKAKRQINTALQDMHVGQGEKFPWAERHAVLVTQSEWTFASTVSVTQGSANITLDTDDFTADRDGNGIYQNAEPGTKFIFNGDLTKLYEFQSAASATAGTLTSVFLGDTNAAATIRGFRAEYPLASDFLKPVDAKQFGDYRNLPLVDRILYRRLYPHSVTPGTPRVATIYERAIYQATPVADDEYQVKRILMHPAPSTVLQIPYSYVTSNLAINNITTTGSDTAGEARPSMVDDDDEPIVPRQGRHAIVLYALAEIYRDARDDQRETSAREQYVDVVNRMIADTGVTSPRPRMRPSRVYKARARRPYAGRGRFDTGGRFDRLEDL
jgi:hypothetical protein